MTGLRCISLAGTEETCYNYGMNTKRLIKVGNKTYERTIQFGNRKKKMVFKNRRAYDRKRLKNLDKNH
jgi:hypothetical protein